MSSVKFVVEPRSKYDNKVMQRWYETESGRIAFQIERLQMEIYRNKNLYLADDILLDGGYSLCKLKPFVAWTIYKTERVNCWQKVLPRAELPKEVLFDILEAQPWIAI